MSSGAIVIAPGAVVGAATAAVAVVAVVAVAAAAAAAVVLVVQAANAAAEAGLRAVGDYGEKLELVAAGQATAEIRAQVWQAVAADVHEVNSRIRMLSERAERKGVAVAVPEKFTMAGHSVAEAARWAAQAAQALRLAQQSMQAVVAAEEGKLTAQRLPQSITARPETAAALARLQQTLRDRHALALVPPVPPRPVAADVDRILRALDPDANERERVEVLAAAAYATAPGDAREVDAYVRSLTSKVASANATVARRRLAAQWLTALEEPVVAGVEPPEPFRGTAGRLRAVLAGDQDLTSQLRAEAAEAVAWAGDIARQNFVCEMMRGILADEGYTVEGGFDAQHSAELSLTRADWRGEHSAEIWVDRRGTVHGHLLREHRAEGDEAAMREHARCADFNATVLRVGRELDADVVVDEAYVPQNANREQVPGTAVQTELKQRRIGG